MTNPYPLAILSFLGVFLFANLLVPFAHRLRLMDVPEGRKKHGEPVPMVGGLAIFIVLSTTLLFIDASNSALIFVCSGLLVCLGVLDDALGLSVSVRLTTQLAISFSMLAGANLWITSVGTDWWGLNDLHHVVAGIVTLVSVVGLINAFNMADGIDGLASGYLLAGLIALAFSNHLFFDRALMEGWQIKFGLFFSCLAFFLMNLSLTPFRRIFLGDSGSTLLGFLMAWVLVSLIKNVSSPMSVVVALWSILVPILDMVYVVIHRITRKCSPFSSDRAHIHYRFIDKGVAPAHVLILMLCVSLSLSCIGISVAALISPMTSLVFAGFLFIMSACLGLYRFR